MKLSIGLGEILNSLKKYLLFKKNNILIWKRVSKEFYDLSCSFVIMSTSVLRMIAIEISSFVWTNVMLCALCYHLYNLRNVKNTQGGGLLSEKLQTSPSCFLNCTNDTKSRKASQVELIYKLIVVKPFLKLPNLVKIIKGAYPLKATWLSRLSAHCY